MSKVVDFSANFAKMMVDAGRDWRAQVPHSGGHSQFYGVGRHDTGNHLNLNRAGSYANPIRQESQVQDLFKQLRGAGVRVPSEGQNRDWAGQVERRSVALSQIKQKQGSVAFLEKFITDASSGTNGLANVNAEHISQTQEMRDQLLMEIKKLEKTADANVAPGHIAALQKTNNPYGNLFGTTHQLLIRNPDGDRRIIGLTSEMANRVEALLIQQRNIANAARSPTAW